MTLNNQRTKSTPGLCMASQEKRMGGGGATRGPTNGGKLEVGEFTFPKVNVARED